MGVTLADAAGKAGILVAILIILINSVKIYFIHVNKRGTGLNVTSLFFMNFGISNLLIGVLALVHSLLTSLQDNDGGMRQEFFVIGCFLIRSALVVSAFNLITIAILRFVAVSKPMVYRKVDRKMMYKLCVAIWILSAAAIAVPFYLFNIEQSNYRIFHAHFFPLVGFSSILVLLIAYGRILLVLWKQRKQQSFHMHYCNSEKCRNQSGAKQKKSKPFPKIDEEFHFDTGAVVENRRESFAYNKRFNSIFELNLVKLIGASMVMYIVCWLPFITYSIVNSMSTFSSSVDNEMEEGIEAALRQFALICNLLLPISYLVYTKRSVQKSIRGTIKKYRPSRRESKGEV